MGHFDYFKAFQYSFTYIIKIEVVGIFWCIVFASYICFAGIIIFISHRLHRICFSGNSKMCLCWLLDTCWEDTVTFYFLCSVKNCDLVPEIKWFLPFRIVGVFFFSLSVRVLNLTQLFRLYIYLYCKIRSFQLGIICLMH